MDLLFIVKPYSWPDYIGFSMIASLVIRIFISFWRMLEIGKKSISLYFRILRGVGYHKNFLEPPIAADFLLGYFLGLLELLAYPILLKSGHAEYIGAWLAFKTIHRWGYAPNYERGTYNRYLFANALILCTSYFMAISFIVT